MHATYIQPLTLPLLCCAPQAWKPLMAHATCTDTAVTCNHPRQHGTYMRTAWTVRQCVSNTAHSCGAIEFVLELARPVLQKCSTDTRKAHPVKRHQACCMSNRLQTQCQPHSANASPCLTQLPSMPACRFDACALTRCCVSTRPTDIACTANGPLSRARRGGHVLQQAGVQHGNLPTCSALLEHSQHRHTADAIVAMLVWLYVVLPKSKAELGPPNAHLEACISYSPRSLALHRQNSQLVALLSNGVALR